MPESGYLLGGPLRRKESAPWIEFLDRVGVPFEVAFQTGRFVEDLQDALPADAGVKLDTLWGVVIASAVSGSMVLVSKEAFCRALPPGIEEEFGYEAVSRAYAGVMAGGSGVFSRLAAALQTGERASEELNLAASAVELCVTQQHQVLRGVYPHSAEDSISSQLLGQRVLAAGLADYMLPKVYEGLDELVLGAKSGGNWLAQWDPLLVPGMSLSATRRLMEALGAFLGGLDDENYREIKRLYALRWGGLDGRMLERLVSKFAWTPEV